MFFYRLRNGDVPSTIADRKRMIKRKDRSLTIDVAPAANPLKPTTAAAIAMIKKIVAQRNILLYFKLN